MGSRRSALSNYLWSIRVVRPRDGYSRTKGMANARSTVWPGHALDPVNSAV